MAGAGRVAGRGAAGARGYAGGGHAAGLHGCLLLLPCRREPRGRARLGHGCDLELPRSAHRLATSEQCLLAAGHVTGCCGRWLAVWSRLSECPDTDGAALGSHRTHRLSVRSAAARHATRWSRRRGADVVQRRLLSVLGDDRHLHPVWRARNRLLSAPRLGAPGGAGEPRSADRRGRRRGCARRLVAAGASRRTGAGDYCRRHGCRGRLVAADLPPSPLPTGRED